MAISKVESRPPWEVQSGHRETTAQRRLECHEKADATRCPKCGAALGWHRVECPDRPSVVKMVERRMKEMNEQMNADATHIMFFHSGSGADFKCKNEKCQFRKEDPRYGSSKL